MRLYHISFKPGQEYKGQKAIVASAPLFFYKKHLISKYGSGIDKIVKLNLDEVWALYNSFMVTIVESAQRLYKMQDKIDKYEALLSKVRALDRNSKVIRDIDKINEEIDSLLKKE